MADIFVEGLTDQENKLWDLYENSMKKRRKDQQRIQRENKLLAAFLYNFESAPYIIVREPYDEIPYLSDMLINCCKTSKNIYSNISNESDCNDLISRLYYEVRYCLELIMRQALNARNLNINEDERLDDAMFKLQKAIKNEKIHRPSILNPSFDLKTLVSKGVHVFSNSDSRTIDSLFKLSISFMNMLLTVNDLLIKS